MDKKAKYAVLGIFAFLMIASIVYLSYIVSSSSGPAPETASDNERCRSESAGAMRCKVKENGETWIQTCSSGADGLRWRDSYKCDGSGCAKDGKKCKHSTV